MLRGLFSCRRIAVLSAAFVEPLVLVDLETTGANATRDRITEIGIVEVDARGVRAWASLVNPGVPIPSFIQSLTGIDDAMVAGAPTFAELAEEVLLRLEGRIFVAHNARFDYGFLKNEFKRAGLALRSRVLCTVKLSRRLYPAEYKHSLDALVARHGLRVDGMRHRALTDAELLLQFLQVVERDHPAPAVQAAITELTRQPALPPGLDPAVLDDLPDGAGVYLFHGERDAPLYVGKSTGLRRRVLSHFAADHKAHKEMQLAQLVRRIDWIETAGELGALLLEARLVKQLRPVFNARLRPSAEQCLWRLVEDDGVLVPRLIDVADLDTDSGGRDFLFGPFRGRREAAKLLEKLAEELGLCRQALGLEPRSRKGGPTPCFGHQLGRCKGVCAGREAPALYNARLLAALGKHAFAAWPWPGPVGLPEGPEWAPQLHVIDRWRYLGTVHDLAELPELLAAPAAPFDIDIYKLLRAEFKKRAGQVRRLG
ncbi:exonuclease domain-containing protein [Chitiniphilus purpureus]|uniref:DNA-directed DNA polymerase n=1 Tax=Chitiniphilus purpureus TaxID=2981137 RepID=A0ABY6DT81_9NEIS|nr:exonuclease domain-containing protein [Chitiniphilus sp. CD1]UXY16281.1 exonuclease domain-containing protein [Chitiniphilus sp. CD1]